MMNVSPSSDAVLPDVSDPAFQTSLVRAIYETTPNGVLVVNERNIIVSYNRRFFEVWEIPLDPAGSASGMIGADDQPILEMVLARVKNPEPFLARLRELYANPALVDESEIELKSGRILQRHTTGLWGPQQQYLGRIWFFQDITERKRAEIELRESETRFRQMFERNHAMMLLIDPASGSIVDANHAASDFYGYSVAQMRALSINDINTLPVETVAKARQQSLRRERNYCVFPHRLANGEIRTVEVHSTPIEVGGRQLLFSIIHDITQQKHAEQELRIAAIAFESQEGMFITDADQVILRVNCAFTEILGYSAEEVIGKTPQLFSSGRHEPAFYSAIWDSIRRSGSWRGEVWNRRKSGEIFPEWLTITAVKGEDGAVTHYVATLADITTRKVLEDEIHHLAFYDALTLLPNRRMLNDRLGRAIATSKRSRKHGALMFLDLDNFKPLNDTYGHNAGDRLLVEVAQRLTACVRETDTVARFGGDEFVVLLSELDIDRDTSCAQAMLVAEKIRAALAALYSLALSGTENEPKRTVHHRCTVSIGLVLFSGNKASQENILKWADIAMYQAKHAGRNQIRVCRPEV